MLLPGKQKLVNQNNTFPILGWKKIFVPENGDLNYDDVGPICVTQQSSQAVCLSLNKLIE